VVDVVVLMACTRPQDIASYAGSWRDALPESSNPFLTFRDRGLVANSSAAPEVGWVCDADGYNMHVYTGGVQDEWLMPFLTLNYVLYIALFAAYAHLLVRRLRKPRAQEARTAQAELDEGEPQARMPVMLLATNIALVLSMVGFIVTAGALVPLLVDIVGIDSELEELTAVGLRSEALLTASTASINSGVVTEAVAALTLELTNGTAIASILNGSALNSTLLLEFVSSAIAPVNGSSAGQWTCLDVALAQGLVQPQVAALADAAGLQLLQACDAQIQQVSPLLSSLLPLIRVGLGPAMDEAARASQLRVQASFEATLQPIYVSTIPWARANVVGLYKGCYAGIVAGLLVSSYLTYNGIRSSWKTYYGMYELLRVHGHTAVRFPLRKANSVRLLACGFFYHFLGVLLMVVICALTGIFVTLLIVDWSGQRMLRGVVANSVILLINEMFWMRCVAIPLMQHFDFGPILFIFELWYLSVGLLRGLVRLVFLLLWVVESFFRPHACMFPDSKESWDAAHTAFACYVMERVEQDKRSVQLQGEFRRAIARKRLASRKRLSAGLQEA